MVPLVDLLGRSLEQELRLAVAAMIPMQNSGGAAAQRSHRPRGGYVKSFLFVAVFVLEFL
jgi:hypothetical protein